MLTLLLAALLMMMILAILATPLPDQAGIPALLSAFTGETRRDKQGRGSTAAQLLGNPPPMVERIDARHAGLPAFDTMRRLWGSFGRTAGLEETQPLAAAQTPLVYV